MRSTSTRFETLQEELREVGENYAGTLESSQWASDLVTRVNAMIDRMESEATNRRATPQHREVANYFLNGILNDPLKKQLMEESINREVEQVVESAETVTTKCTHCGKVKPCVTCACGDPACKNCIAEMKKTGDGCIGG